jgi:hypothetical protein
MSWDVLASWFKASLTSNLVRERLTVDNPLSSSDHLKLCIATGLNRSEHAVYT